MDINTRKIIIPDGVTSIPDEAFKDCKDLEEIIIPNSVIEIGNEAFSGCTNLKSINLSNVKSIYEFAFKDCDNITSIYIPDTLEDIAPGALSYMHSLESIEVSPKNKKYITYDNLSLLNKLDNNVVQYAVGAKNKVYKIPESNEHNRHIYKTAFAGCKYLNELRLDTSICYLDKNAFDDSNNLKTLHVSYSPSSSILEFIVNEDNCNFPFDKVHIENGITTIGTKCFSGFRNLKNVELPNESLKTIYHSAFKYCENLDDISVPSSIDSILVDTISEYSYFVFENGIIIANTKLLNKDDTIKKDYHFEGRNNYRLLVEENISGNNNDLNNGFLMIDYKTLLALFDNKHDDLKNITIRDAIEREMNSLAFLKLPKEEEYSTEVDLTKNSNLYSKIREILTLDKGNNMALKFIRCFDTKTKKMIDLSGTLNDIESLRTFIKLAHMLGAFESDYNIRKNALEFINNDLLTKIRGKDIYNLFNKIQFESEFDLPLANFFVDCFHISNKQANKNTKFYIAILSDILEYLATDDLSAKFIQSLESNMKRMIDLSETSKNKSTDIVNMKDLLKLAKILGAFEENKVIRQRALTFINDNVLTSRKQNSAIIGDDIHRFFNDLAPRSKFDSEFARFFMKNYQEIYNKELGWPGFICRTYNRFPEISLTSTSDKGNGRHLMVTFEKVCNYLFANKFKNVSDENKELAIFLGYWYDNEKILIDANKVLKESFEVARNIFINDSDPTHDLKENINSEYSYEWLPKQSMVNLILGKYCNSCAHINGNGLGIVRASMTSPVHQNMVIKNDKGKIIGKSTIYINPEEGYAVFNNIESNMNYRNEEDLTRIYNAFMRGAKAFMDKYNENNPDKSLKIITIGTTRNTVKTLFEQHDIIHPVNDILEAPKYGNYSLYEEKGNYTGNSDVEQRLILKK